MTCRKASQTENCLCSILKNIANAQHDISKTITMTSCEKSISDLLGKTKVGSRLDTVPILLYCGNNCLPFKGYGIHPHHQEIVVSSYYFRINHITSNCSAQLELLRDPNDTCNPHDPCDQATKNLQTTGICITANINCFCHMTCLPAINALSS